MGHTRLTRQKVDKLMGREKKRRKKESSKPECSSSDRPDNRDRTNRSTRSQRAQNIFEEETSTGGDERKKKEMDVSSCTNNYNTDLNEDYPNHAPVPDLTMEDEREEVNVSTENRPCDLPKNDDRLDGSLCADDEKSDIRRSGERNEFDKWKKKVINADNLLGCLLTCGSQRLSSVMYTVVRTVLSGRECAVCGAPVPGAKLPGLTYLKSELKPCIKMNLLPKHEVIQVRVDRSRAGAKYGIDKYQSDALAPLTVVKPCEWARVDFATPSVRKLIWEDSTTDGTVFSNIEATPIVRHRSFFPSVNTVRDSGGLESLVGGKSRLQLTFVLTSKADKALEKAFSGSVVKKVVNDVESAVVSCEVLEFEYVSDDREGHNGINCAEEQAVFELHEGNQDKAGDVIFYLKCQHGMARLVNSHNCDEYGQPCRLELCNGKRTGCHVRTFPVEDVVCTDSSKPHDDYVPNKGRLEDGTKYYIYRFLLYTDGFNAHRSRLGSMDGMYMLPLGIPIDRRTEAGCLHKICLAPPGVSATDIMDEVIDDLADGMTNGIEVDDNGERALIFPDGVVYTGDGPALASATGSKGHSADCPCHACSFRKDKNKVLTIVGSQVSTTTCFAKRTHTKIRDIARQEGNDTETMHEIGVSNLNAPLMKLSDRVKCLNIPKTSEGKQVVPNCFDAYRFSLISPDHVFLGLINNVLELIMKLLKRANRDKFDSFITDILRYNGLYGRTTILNSERNIMKTTISEAFAILFAAPVAIKCCNFNVDGEEHKGLKTAIILIRQLSRITVNSQSHPKRGVDNEADLRSFNNSDGRKRLNRLVTDVKNHCKTIEELSRIDEKHVGILDKPNMHRFVELFVHSLPMFGSLRFIEELILEKAHQTAKKAIDMSNNKNEQLQAMNDYLFDDFVCRLKSVTRSAETGLENCIAREIEQLTGNSCNLNVRTLTDPNVLSVLRILGKDICHRSHLEEWCVEEKSKFKYPHKSEKTLDQARKFVEKALELMSQRDSWKQWSCGQAASATFVKPIGEIKEIRRVARVIRFDVIEVHCREGVEERPFVFRRSELDGDRRFIVVIGFLRTVQDGKKVEYAVGYFMDPVSQESVAAKKEEGNKNCEGRQEESTGNNEHPGDQNDQGGTNSGKVQEATSGNGLDKATAKGDHSSRRNQNGERTGDKTQFETSAQKRKPSDEDGNDGPDCEKEQNASTRMKATKEADRKKAEEEAARKKAEEEAARKKAEEDDREPVYERNTKCVVIFELSRSVRKAFVAHACWMKDEQSPNPERSCVNSCSFLSRLETIVECGKWVLKGRKEGFPPRSG